MAFVTATRTGFFISLHRFWVNIYRLNPRVKPCALMPQVPGSARVSLLQRIAFIEKAGTGIRRMREDAKKSKCPEPEFAANGFFTATFRPSTAQVPTKYRASTVQVTALLQAVAQKPKSREELQMAAGIKHRQHFLNVILKPVLATGWLEMTTPDKPRSSKQQYRTAASF